MRIHSHYNLLDIRSLYVLLCLKIVSIEMVQDWWRLVIFHILFLLVKTSIHFQSFFYFFHHSHVTTHSVYISSFSLLKYAFKNNALLRILWEIAIFLKINIYLASGVSVKVQFNFSIEYWITYLFCYFEWQVYSKYTLISLKFPFDTFLACQSFYIIRLLHSSR